MIDNAGAYYEVSASGAGGSKLEQAQISLNDCLACRYVNAIALKVTVILSFDSVGVSRRRNQFS